MFANVSTAELCYALACLSREEPDTREDAERETLATSLVREIMAREDMPTARDAAIERESTHVRIFQNGAEIHTRAQQFYFGEIIVEDEQERNRHPAREGIAFFGTRPVTVNGTRLRLKWAK